MKRKLLNLMATEKTNNAAPQLAASQHHHSLKGNIQGTGFQAIKITSPSP
jgi:hypothetical protein